MSQSLTVSLRMEGSNEKVGEISMTPVEFDQVAERRLTFDKSNFAIVDARRDRNDRLLGTPRGTVWLRKMDQ
jgi:hypothetical protein